MFFFWCCLPFWLLSEVRSATDSVYADYDLDLMYEPPLMPGSVFKDKFLGVKFQDSVVEWFSHYPFGMGMNLNIEHEVERCEVHIFETHDMLWVHQQSLIFKFHGKKTTNHVLILFLYAVLRSKQFTCP